MGNLPALPLAWALACCVALVACGEPTYTETSLLPDATINADVAQGSIEFGMPDTALWVPADHGGADSGSTSPAAPPGGGSPPAQPGDGSGSCQAPDLKTLTPCCDGAAYCMPPDMVPDALASRLALCADGSVCVPVDYIGGGGKPKACTSAGGAEGACTSACVPQVADYADLLPQDVCDDGSLCAPCVDPLTKQDSGACEEAPCAGVVGDDPPEPPDDVGPGDEGGKDEDDGALSCENPPTAPLIDTSLLPECCPGARCLPASMLPPEQADQAAMLSKCDAGLCVPDELIETLGFYTPTKCVSVGNAEGRCLSTCIPLVSEQMDQLPVNNCGADQRCVPCCDPFTGEPTGACDVGCDTGVAGGFCSAVFPPCCDTTVVGHCVDPGLVPSDKQGNLETCDNGLVCVPDIMQDLTWKGSPCSGTMLFGDWYQGVCLPECLKIPLEFSMDKSGCQAGFVCAPCKDPFLGLPTGAPGC